MFKEAPGKSSIFTCQLPRAVSTTPDRRTNTAGTSGDPRTGSMLPTAKPCVR